MVNKQVQAFENETPNPESESHDRANEKKKKKGSAKPPNIGRAVAAKLAAGDVRGAVRIASSDDSIALPTVDILDKLREKHPPRHPQTIVPPAPTNDDICARLTPQIVARAIRSFPNGSAGGPDRLLPQHLKDLSSTSNGEAGARLLQAITDFANEIVLKAKVPDQLTPYFYGSNLIALRKKDGGIRPIAVGNTLRRLIAKACVFTLGDDIGAFFFPNQLGCGTARGAEIAGHAARRYSELAAGNVLLKIDFKNAFNTVRRDFLLAKVKSSFPAIYPFVYQAYSSDSKLNFGLFELASAEGVQQGDPLGPLLFCLAIQPLVMSCLSELNLWYLDDGTLGGPPDTVLSDLERVVNAEANLGLSINSAKCELIVLSEDEEFREDCLTRFRSVAPDIQATVLNSATLLGSPLSKEAADTVLQEKLKSLEQLTHRLKDLDAHDAYFLLRHCFSIPKLLYTLRSAPCFDSPWLREYDKALNNALENIIGVAMSETAFAQATLPVEFGGLGIRLASSLSLGAFLSSSHGALEGVRACLPVRFGQLVQREPIGCGSHEPLVCCSNRPCRCSSA